MKKLTLSDAILKGCKMRPKQCFGNYFCGDGRSCVLGAIADGAGRSDTADYLIELFPELRTWVLKDCKENSGFYVGYYGRALESVLVTLNDTYKWPREKIAQWLKSYNL